MNKLNWCHSSTEFSFLALSTRYCWLPILPGNLLFFIFFFFTSNLFPGLSSLILKCHYSPGFCAKCSSFLHVLWMASLQTEWSSLSASMLMSHASRSSHTSFRLATKLFEFYYPKVFCMHLFHSILTTLLLIQCLSLSHAFPWFSPFFAYFWYPFCEIYHIICKKEAPISLSSCFHMKASEQKLNSCPFPRTGGVINLLIASFKGKNITRIGLFLCLSGVSLFLVFEVSP